MDLLNEDRLSEIERKIDTLISAYRQVKEEQAQLLLKNKALETENSELKNRLQEMRNEREILISKVKGILEKIEMVEV